MRSVLLETNPKAILDRLREGVTKGMEDLTIEEVSKKLFTSLFQQVMNECVYFQLLQLGQKRLRALVDGQ
jgi:hypothetical protein